MDDKFNEQKDILIAIKKEISLLHQQVEYLIRNEKNLELLDLDVMMNRTHTIYDLMCRVNVGSEELGLESEEEELPVGLDEIRGLFGIEEKQEEELDDLEEQEEQEGLELDKEETEEENEGAYFIEEAEEEESNEEPKPTSEVSEMNMAENSTPVERDETQDEVVPEEHGEGNTWEVPEDRGFILNFEQVETPVEEPSDEPIEAPREAENTSVYTTGDEIEMTIPHFDEPEDTKVIGEETTEEIPFEPVVIGDIKEKEDGGFELETPETLGERLQQQQDPTLADKLQHSALNSLQSAIGINDKFLFVNELFNGSMEKYNRSIANLDDLKTLNGALIYLNELRVELQWNSSNEAYKKILELVHRKFGA